MEIHILNGDALIDRMQSAGFTELIVCRECLIDGPVKADSLDEFWSMRERFLAETPEDHHPYYDLVESEFEKLKHIPADANIHLWFGDDLFCQANMWFIVDYLRQQQRTEHLYRVFPKIEDEKKRWHEYGGLNADEFRVCYATRVSFSTADVQLACKLWQAYADDRPDSLQLLSRTSSPCFRYLEEVVQAHIDRFPQSGELGRPERTLKELLQSGITDFNNIFPAFSNREGIYGFGDDQVKSLLEKIT